MTIDPNDPRITAYVFGELPADELSEFEALLEESGELQSLVDQTRKAVSLLEFDMKLAPRAKLLPEQRAAVVAGMDGGGHPDSAPRVAAAEKSGPAPPRKPVHAKLPPGQIAAACAVLLVGSLAVGGMYLFRSPAPNVALSAKQDVPPAEPASNFDSPYELTVLPEFGDMMQDAPGDTRAATSPNVVEFPRVTNDIEITEQTVNEPMAGPTLDRPVNGKPPGFAGGAGGSLGGYGGQPDSPARGGMGGGGGPADANFGAVPKPAGLAPPGMGLAEGMPGGGGGDFEGLGTTPDQGGDRFQTISENPFQRSSQEPLSTFSIDVDTASYSKVRMYLERGQLPRPDAVRLEEMINYFRYGYEPPAEDGDAPFAAHFVVSECPWAPSHRLVRIALKGREFKQQRRPDANLVFLIDVSGSMDRPNKLPLLIRGMKMLTNQLVENDRVAIVVYAGAAGLVLDSTAGANKQQILAALDRLRAGGSTNGGQGIHLAYQTALDHFKQDGINRVILCSDGDFNVGTTGTGELVKLAAEKAKTGVFLSVLGFGMGNHNDSMMEQVSNRGNGNYAFIDNDAESAKVLVEQMDATLVTIAKDVKVQVEFNPSQVAAYRMLGYENRRLAAEDFANDKKDAGEIGAGHTVTMLYEIVPVGAESDADLPPSKRKLRYQRTGKQAKANPAHADELLTVALRYKQPDGDKSKLLEFPLQDELKKFGEADSDFRFAAAVASFGMLLRGSEHRGDANYDAVLEIAAEAAGSDPLRLEMLQLVRQARALSQK